MSTVTEMKTVSALSERDWTVLLRRIDLGKCTPFIGPEVCRGASPTNSEIAREWAEKEEYPLEDAGDFSRVAQYLAVKIDQMEPQLRIKERLGKVPAPNFRDAGEPHAVLADLPLPVYVTTNYDDFLVRALRDRKRDVRRERCRWNEDPAEPGAGDRPLFDGDYSPTVANPVVFHLFGHVDAPESLVLTEDDYLDFLIRTSRDAEEKLIPSRVRRAFREASLLFLGYRPMDLDFRVLLRTLANSLKGRKHVAVQLITPGNIIAQAQLERVQQYLDQRFEKLEIEVCWMGARPFLAELKQRWEAFHHGN